jgi:hypothetical protein
MPPQLSKMDNKLRVSCAEGKEGNVMWQTGMENHRTGFQPTVSTETDPMFILADPKEL